MATMNLAGQGHKAMQMVTSCNYSLCSNKYVCIYRRSDRLRREGQRLPRPSKSRVLPLSTSAASSDMNDEDDNKRDDQKVTQDAEEDDWGTAVWNESSQEGRLFKRDGPFAVFLIIVSTIVSTVIFQMGFRKIKNVSRISKSRQQLSQSSSVYAPVLPKDGTAKRYKTGWPDDNGDHWSNTVEDTDKLPLRTPQGDDDLDTAILAQRQQYERLKAQVDGTGDHAIEKVEGQQHEGYYDWDAIFSDDEAPYSGMSLTEMKDRAKKASKAATRAAGYAHQASVAASIATKATSDAQTAAHRAIEAALKSERALERNSGQAIVEAYAAARKAEDEAEKSARIAAEMAAKSLMDERSSNKFSREAVACEDVTRPHGLLNKARAIWFDVSTMSSSALSACHDVSVKFVNKAKIFLGLLKQHLPNNKISSQ